MILSLFTIGQMAVAGGVRDLVKIAMVSICVTSLTTTVESAPAQRPLSAEAFFEVLHPKHERNPAWPDRLTLEIDEKITLSEIKAILRRHRWRTAYECDGRPAAAHRYLFDGIHRGLQDSTFDERRVTRFELSTSDEELNSQSAGYEVTEEGNGKFVLRYPSGKFFSQTVAVAFVRETGERILVHDGSYSGLCPGSTLIRALRVPTGTPVF